ncbi:MAG: cytochrome c oxidase subunit 3 [Acidobacteriota bacterium]|nr:cytochrome c oxidase subunit 3 [Acidobacteriota bacterium]
MATLTESGIGAPPPPDVDLPRGGGGGDDSGRNARGGSRSASIAGIVVLMCASLMTFGAMISAMVMRREVNTDWQSLPLPRILYWNTGILLISSVVIDTARRMLKRNKRKYFNALWTAGTVLGTSFLIGQTIAWRQLESKGFYLIGNPSSAFFYVLTWAHAAHVIGALFGVGYVEYRALRYELGPAKRTWVDVSAIFWHFLDVLWLCIMGLFVYWA